MRRESMRGELAMPREGPLMTRPLTKTKKAFNLHSAVASALESLEGRTLLANAPLSVNTFLVGTTAWLNVTGTTGDDTIVVQKTAATTFRITNGTWAVNKTGSWPGVRVAAGAGADAFTASGSLTFRVIAYGEAGNDTLSGGALADSLFGGNDNDSLVGGGGNDTLRGEAGNDTHRGGSGADNVLGNVGNDLIEGGADNDSLGGDAGADTIYGGSGNDTLFGGTEADLIIAGDGNDSLRGDASADTLNGDAGNDIVYGGTEADLIEGGTGNDSLYGDAGADTLTGSAGTDYLNGGADNDSVDGGADGDKVIGDLGNDTYIGGAGADNVDYTGRTVSLSLSLDGQANDGATGETDNISDDFETVIGGNVADTITGNANANSLNGGAGNDTIVGGDGNDKLYGGAGNDSITGDGGADSLWGQGDNDALFGNAGEDLLEGGAGNDQSDGGADRDRLIAIGGGIYDSVTGGDGLDSYWLDKDTTERTLDVSSDETTARAVHRVASFVKLGTTVVSKELTYQKFADPTLPALPPEVRTTKLVNFSGNKLFASNGPSADDIAQGLVGDCWYLATLAAVADVTPEVVRQSVTDLGDGTYAVRYFSGSAEQYVRVDADIYTYSWDTSAPLFAGLGAENSIWAPIMEKALTWVRGSNLGKYATISSGWMSEAYGRIGMSSTLTNTSKSSGTNNVSAMLNWIQTRVTAGRSATVAFNSVSGANLLENHAYSIDRVNDLGGGTFTITLRNPWGVDGNSSTDGLNDGYVTLTSAQLYSNYVTLSAA
jgi:Ca2+-binding RTX toxin-like protein